MSAHSQPVPSRPLGPRACLMAARHFCHYWRHFCHYWRHLCQWLRDTPNQWLRDTPNQWLHIKDVPCAQRYLISTTHMELEKSLTFGGGRGGSPGALASFAENFDDQVLQHQTKGTRPQTKEFFAKDQQFHTQKRCIAQVENKRQQPAAVDAGYCLWASDVSANRNGSKFYVSAAVQTMADSIQQMPVECRTLYETIPGDTKVKPYIDVDWYMQNTGVVLQHHHRLPHECDPHRC